jgi:hypothetical protein
LSAALTHGACWQIKIAGNKIAGKNKRVTKESNKKPRWCGAEE